ncbi:MAG: NAD(P)/FAD-dependent oxidoreductase [Halobacteriota archaeon]
MRSEYDVIVVGAGPGGSMAARAAAENCDVLLIEKRQEIGTPVRCAEGVLKSALLDLVSPNAKWISSYIRGYRIFAPDGTALEISAKAMGIEDDLAYILERKIFDRELAKDAARAGADISVRTRATGLIIEDGAVRGVKINRLGEDLEVSSKVVIGADGVESQVGRWAGIDTTVMPKDAGSGAQYLMANVDVAEDLCDIYLGSQAAGGYAWVFPKGEKLANVGVGVPKSILNGKKAIAYLDEFVSKQFPTGQQLGLIMGSTPLSDELKTVISEGLMLIGDAAHHCDPLSGGGITTAMEGGKIAGDVASKAVRLGDVSVHMLSEYELRRRQTLFGTLQKHNYRIKEFLTSVSDRELNKVIRVLKDVRPQETNIMRVGARLIIADPKILFVARDLARLKQLVDLLPKRPTYPISRPS